MASAEAESWQRVLHAEWRWCGTLLNRLHLLLVLLLLLLKEGLEDGYPNGEVPWTELRAFAWP
jgi:hypothetical protein